MLEDWNLVFDIYNGKVYVSWVMQNDKHSPAK